MAKMVNPNSISDMALMNNRAQAKMAQLIQKLGKGKRRVKVTFTKGSRNYLTTMVTELKKKMVDYEKQLPNVFQFFNYLEKEVKITKENKKIKEKEVVLSYDELDYLKFQIKETVKEIDKNIQNLKWFNFLKKSAFKMIKKQNEVVLEELNKTSVIK